MAESALKVDDLHHSFLVDEVVVTAHTLPRIQDTVSALVVHRIEFLHPKRSPRIVLNSRSPRLLGYLCATYRTCRIGIVTGPGGSGPATAPPGSAMPGTWTKLAFASMAHGLVDKLYERRWSGQE